jgi:hypothetical protein
LGQNFWLKPGCGFLPFYAHLSAISTSGQACYEASDQDFDTKDESMAAESLHRLGALRSLIRQPLIDDQMPREVTLRSALSLYRGEGSQSSKTFTPVSHVVNSLSNGAHELPSVASALDNHSDFMPKAKCSHSSSGSWRQDLMPTAVRAYEIDEPCCCQV